MRGEIMAKTTNIGSQLRYNAEEDEYTRKWLSLLEYYNAFGVPVPRYSSDFRTDKSVCKWCGKPLEGNKQNFCSKECADDYSWRVTERRTLPALPHRVALRDNFTCIYCGKDVASTNRHGMRLPVSSGDCSCDHLIPVARGGTDHISNLGCACKDCNFKKGVLTIDEFYVKLGEERLKEENK